MSVDIQADVVIARSRSEVAAFMFEPRNDPLWTRGLVEVRALGEGPLVKGARVERVSKFLGRRFGYVIEVLDHEPERSVEMLATQPFEMRVRYELEDEGAGTRARIRARGGGSRFFRLAAPLLARSVKRSISADLDQLKQQLERGADHPAVRARG